jgi:hypothetical protein
MQFNLALAEAKQSQLRAEYYAKRIETGSYKERIGKSLNLDKTPRTEQEILRDEVGTMHNHITRAEEHLDWAKHYLSNN